MICLAKVSFGLTSSRSRNHNPVYMTSRVTANHADCIVKHDLRYRFSALKLEVIRS